MSNILNDDSHLYDAIINLLNTEPGKWWSSHEIMYHPAMKEFLENFGNKRVSNYIGNLYRRDVIKRQGAGAHACMDGSRYVYSIASDDSKSSLLVNKPNLRIAEDGKQIIIDLPGFTITIDSK